MFTTATNEPTVPNDGWYPDPAGDRQWRRWSEGVWTGDVTPYAPEASSLAARMEAIQAQDYLSRIGAPAYFAGFGLLINAARQPLSSNATNYLIALCEILALALLVIGHMAFSRAASVLASQSRLLCVLPLVNLLAWTYWAWERATYVLPVARHPLTRRREAANGALIAQSLAILLLLVDALTSQPASRVGAAALMVIPAIPAAIAIRWSRLLRDDLSG
jgi:hypothetical protein